MINELQLNGFKSFLRGDIEFSPLTVLTGLNSSGKSSVIQAIRMLDRITQGVFDPLLNEYGSAADLRNPNVRQWTMSAQYSNGSTIDIVENHFSNSTRDSYAKVLYISAGRLGPQVSLKIRKDDILDENGENVLKCLEDNQDLIIPEGMRHPNAEGNTLLYNVRAWLGTISPRVEFKWDINEKTDSSYSLFDGHRAKNVGFGLSYTLPIIVALLLASAHGNTIVLLENPEAHLRPRGQVEMAMLVAKAVECGVQVIVETHSDHFFDGIRIAVKEAEGNSLASKVLAYWFELDTNKNTQFEQCSMDSDGRMIKWPKGMFDQFEVDALKLM